MFFDRATNEHSPIRKTGQTARSATEDSPTILVIDDEVNIVTLIERIVSNAGHRVLKALSDDEGLAIFDRERVDFDISDLGLPGMSGWDVGKSIQANLATERNRQAPLHSADGMGRSGTGRGKDYRVRCRRGSGQSD